MVHHGTQGNHWQDWTTLKWPPQPPTATLALCTVYSSTFSEGARQVLPAVHDVTQQQQRLLPHRHVLALQLAIL